MTEEAGAERRSTGRRDAHPWGHAARQESCLRRGPLGVCQHYRPSFSSHSRRITTAPPASGQIVQRGAAGLRCCHFSATAKPKYSFKHRSISQLINTHSEMLKKKKRMLRTCAAIRVALTLLLYYFRRSNPRLQVQPVSSWSWTSACPSTVPPKGNDVAEGPARPFYHRY